MPLLCYIGPHRPIVSSRYTLIFAACNTNADMKAVKEGTHFHITIRKIVVKNTIHVAWRESVESELVGLIRERNDWFPYIFRFMNKYVRIRSYSFTLLNFCSACDTLLEGNKLSNLYQRNLDYCISMNGEYLH